MTDLGLLYNDTGGTAYSVNEHDQVVGVTTVCTRVNPDDSCHGAVYNAFLWERGSMVDLQTLLLPGSSITLSNNTGRGAYNINDRGEIAGEGVLPNGESRAVLLIPCDGNHEGIEDCDYSLVDATTSVERAALALPRQTGRPAVSGPASVVAHSRREVVRTRCGTKSQFFVEQSAFARRRLVRTDQRRAKDRGNSGLGSFCAVGFGGWSTCAARFRQTRETWAESARGGRRQERQLTNREFAKSTVGLAGQSRFDYIEVFYNQRRRHSTPPDHPSGVRTAIGPAAQSNSPPNRSKPMRCSSAGEWRGTAYRPHPPSRRMHRASTRRRSYRGSLRDGVELNRATDRPYNPRHDGALYGHPTWSVRDPRRGRCRGDGRGV